MDNVIVFSNVYKVYKLYRSDKERLLSLIKKPRHELRKVAANYLSFKINRGDKVAILGPNGAGKSTILKLITNVCYPDEGNISVKGKVGALLELSAGFDMEFTGRENIYLKCLLLGLTDKEIKKVEKSILEFASLGDYIDQPVRTYSSGMKARLGFSIIINCDVDILIIDEVLSVGDKDFREKCLNKIRELSSKKDLTMLFVTHSLEQAREFCNRGIIINKGHLVYDAPIDKTIMEFNKLF